MANPENSSSFSQKKLVDAHGQPLEYLETRPSGAQTGPDTIIVPGHLGPPLSFREVTRELTEQYGHRVLSVLTDHGLETPALEVNIPPPQQRKVAALEGMMDAQNIARVKALAHSEGAITLTGQATLHPERIEDSVLYAPAGIERNDNLLSFLWGVWKNSAKLKAAKAKLRDEKNDDALRLWDEVAAEGTRLQKQNPRQTRLEVFGLAGAHIGELLKRLQGDHGKKFAILAPEDDELFPIARDPQKTSKLTGIPEQHIHIIPKRTHMAHVENPTEFTSYLMRAWQKLRGE